MDELWSVLIVTYGRSGSTLLQGVLNTIPGMYVKGENFNFCYGLYESWKSLIDSGHKSNSTPRPTNRPTSPWYGAHTYKSDEFLAGVSLLIKQQLVGDVSDVQCFGFKEIRYLNMDSSSLMAYLDFLVLVLPKLGIIFNTRPLDDVVKSGWWKARSFKQSKASLSRLENNFDVYARSRANCYTIDYEDVINQTNTFRGLFQFLGAAYDENKIENVLSELHSYDQSNSVLARLGRLKEKL